VIRAQERDALAAHLQADGIGCAIHYPTPLPLLPAYKSFQYSADSSSNALSASKEILSLPMYPELTDADVDRIGLSIEKFYSRD
jgi:dTDP-4-amino-4,6-dideoxygalactose transaminase